MGQSDKYRQYAEDDKRWAGSAPSAELRQAFLELARYWSHKAARAEGINGAQVKEPEAQTVTGEGTERPSSEGRGV